MCNEEFTYLQHFKHNMSLIDRFIGVLAPHECLGCGLESSLLCNDCADGLSLLAKLCYRCQRPDGAPACPNCLLRGPFENIYASAPYTGLAKELVWQLKYNGAQAAARTMARQIAPLLPVNSWNLVPVPTASSRARQRGYDQAVLIAKELSRLSGFPCSRLLRRRGQAHQVGAGRRDRLSQLEDVFWVKAPSTLNTPILLIDDVLTTGATLETAAQALHQAGIKHVSAAVFAQTLV